MKLLTREEVEKITKDNICNDIVQKVMKQVLTAANNGQWGITYKEDSFDALTVKAIEDTFRDLGYEVTIKEFNYVGSLKKGMTIKINWCGN